MVWKKRTETEPTPGRLEALLKREEALKAAIAAEQIKNQKRKQKDRTRLVTILGEAVLDRAGSMSDFDLMIRQMLAGMEFDYPQRQFLTRMGWL